MSGDENSSHENPPTHDDQSVPLPGIVHAAIEADGTTLQNSNVATYSSTAIAQTQQQDRAGVHPEEGAEEDMGKSEDPDIVLAAIDNMLHGGGELTTASDAGELSARPDEHDGPSCKGQQETTATDAREPSARPDEHDGPSSNGQGVLVPKIPKPKPMGSFGYSSSFVRRRLLAKDATAWLRDRNAVDMALMRSRILLLFVGMVGMVFSIIQNEAIFKNEDPKSSGIALMKACNTLCSLVLVVLLVRHYRFIVLMERIRMHLQALRELNTRIPLLEVLKHGWLWVEIIACVPHCPPGLTFEVVHYNWLNIVMYRAETIFCIYNSFRIYLLWPVLRDWMLYQLPKRHTVAAFTKTRMDSAFALKRILNGPHAMAFICYFWILTFFVTGYWFRAAEVTACLFTTSVSPECKESRAKVWILGSSTAGEFQKENDLYVWNAMWGMFITATSVGYGDILSTTHLGRVVALVAAVSGLVCVAALTASFSVTLMWTERELSALLLIEREQAKMKVRDLAILVIQYWVRKKKGTLSESQRKRMDNEIYNTKKEFQKKKQAMRVELDDCKGDSAKFDTIFHRTKYIFEAMQEIEEKTGEEIVPTVMRQESELVQKAKQTILQRRKTSLKVNAQKLLPESPSSLAPEPPPLEKGSRKGSTNVAEELTRHVTRQRLSVLTTELKEGTLKQAASTDAMPVKVASWRRSRQEISKRITLTHLMLAFVSLIGCLCAVASHELTVRSHHPRSAAVTLAKTGNLICSLVLMVLFYLQYWLEELLERMYRHLKRGETFEPNVPPAVVLSEQWFWFEMILCCLHLPPGITGESSWMTLDNIVVYRYEMIGCCYNILARVYLMWHPIRTYMMSDIPNSTSVAAFANVRFDSIFVLKRMVNSWNAASYLGFATGIGILLFGYLFRCVEITACQFPHTEHKDCLKPNAQTWVIYGTQFEKANDLYVWNFMWLTFVTMTTVGYGDQVPETHLGRLICAISSIIGILIASLITAAITNVIIYSPEEQAATSVIEREQARQELRKVAVTTITLWWKRLKNKRISRRQSKIDKHVLRRAFLELKLDTMQEVEDLQSMSSKIDKVSRQMKMIATKLEKIAENLWTHDEVVAMEKEWEEAAKEAATEESKAKLSITGGSFLHHVGTGPTSVDEVL